LRCTIREARVVKNGPQKTPSRKNYPDYKIVLPARKSREKCDETRKRAYERAELLAKE